MKKTIILILALLAPIMSEAQALDYNGIVSEALGNNDFFTLRETCEEHAEDMNPLLLKLAKSIADVAFHKHEEAEEGFVDLFTNHANDIELQTLMTAAYFASRNYEVMQNYQNAAKICQDIVDIVESLENVPNSAADAFRTNSQRYRDLSMQPIMTLDPKSKGWTIPIVIDTLVSTRKRIAQMSVDGTMNGKPIHAVFDTGAGFNIIRTSYAKQLGLRIIGANSTIQGGGSVQGTMAIADEMTIGDVKFHNVLFFVNDMSTGNEEADKVASVTNIIIGRPCMHLMQEFTMDFEKMRITVPATPAKYDNPNIVFLPNNFLHYVRCQHNGETIDMNIDTGNLGQWGYLGTPYYRAHQSEVDAVTEFEESRIAGVGGAIETQNPVLHDFSLSIGGKDITFPKILVSRQPEDGSVLTLNTLGFEFFSHQKRITISYKWNKMVVE